MFKADSTKHNIQRLYIELNIYKDGMESKDMSSLFGSYF